LLALAVLAVVGFLNVKRSLWESSRRVMVVALAYYGLMVRRKGNFAFRDPAS
jgi:hypothetical protein